MKINIKYVKIKRLIQHMGVTTEQFPLEFRNLISGETGGGMDLRDNTFCPPPLNILWKYVVLLTEWSNFTLFSWKFLARFARRYIFTVFFDYNHIYRNKTKFFCWLRSRLLFVCFSPSLVKFWLRSSTPSPSTLKIRWGPCLRLIIKFNVNKLF